MFDGSCYLFYYEVICYEALKHDRNEYFITTFAFKLVFYLYFFNIFATTVTSFDG